MSKDRYSITKHIEYDKLMQNYISKDKVTDKLRDLITENQQLKKALAQKPPAPICPSIPAPKPDPCAKCNVKKHPDYLALKDAAKTVKNNLEQELEQEKTENEMLRKQLEHEKKRNAELMDVVKRRPGTKVVEVPKQMSIKDNPDYQYCQKTLRKLRQQQESGMIGNQQREDKLKYQFRTAVEKLQKTLFGLKGHCSEADLQAVEQELNKLRAECGMGPISVRVQTKFLQGPIDKHPDYPALMAEQNQLEKQLDRYKNMDISQHPDYAYMKSKYEHEIKQLKKQCDKDIRSANKPKGAHKPERHGKSKSKSKSKPTNKTDHLPAPFAHTEVPQLNPTARMSSGVYKYDPVRLN